MKLSHIAVDTGQLSLHMFLFTPRPEPCVCVCVCLNNCNATANSSSCSSVVLKSDYLLTAHAHEHTDERACIYTRLARPHVPRVGHHQMNGEFDARNHY